MPAWGNTLFDQEIDEIITWFQEQRPEEIYRAWSKRNTKFANK